MQPTFSVSLQVIEFPDTNALFSTSSRSNSHIEQPPTTNTTHAFTPLFTSIIIIFRSLFLYSLEESASSSRPPDTPKWLTRPERQETHCAPFYTMNNRPKNATGGENTHTILTCFSSPLFANLALIGLNSYIGFEGSTEPDGDNYHQDHFADAFPIEGLGDPRDCNYLGLPSLRTLLTSLLDILFDDNYQQNYVGPEDDVYWHTPEQQFPQSTSSYNNQDGENLQVFQNSKCFMLTSL